MSRKPTLFGLLRISWLPFLQSSIFVSFSSPFWEQIVTVNWSCSSYHWLPFESGVVTVKLVSVPASASIKPPSVDDCEGSVLVSNTWPGIKPLTVFIASKFTQKTTCWFLRTSISCVAKSSSHRPSTACPAAEFQDRCLVVRYLRHIRQNCNWTFPILAAQLLCSRLVFTAVSCSFATRIIYCTVFVTFSSAAQISSSLFFISSVCSDIYIQSSSKLPCCFLHNCCMSEPLRCHLSERGAQPIGWDEKMWGGCQTCLLKGSEGKPDKLDIWSSFLTFFLHILRVFRYTTDRMSADMVVSWDFWLFLDTADTQLLSWVL